MRKNVGTWLAVPALAGAMINAKSPPPIRSLEIGAQRGFRVNGAPFVPIRSWLQRPTTYSDLRKLGFNTPGANLHNG